MKARYLIFFILAAAILSRLSFLNLRPLHHDEGVNYFFVSQILEFGKFSYDPLNYHGPLYFFAIFISFLIFGISEFSLRFPTGIFGIGLIAIPLLLKKYRHFFNPYIASLFILLSPSILYYSRYSIHEISLVLFSLVAILIFTFMLEKKSLLLLSYFSLSLAMLLSIKETSLLIFLVSGIIGLIHRKTIIKLPWRENFYLVIISISLFLFMYLSLYSAFFTNINGFYQSFAGFVPWLQRGFQDQGHFKPFYYYLWLMIQYELPLFILALYGLWFSKKNIVTQNIAIWFFLSFFIYSAIQYKMPWIVINITLPMCFLASVGYHNLPFNLWIKKGILFFSLSYLTFFSVYTNILYPWQKVNQFAYVHTDKNILGLIEKIHTLSDGSTDILLISDEYWPLPFYLREKRVQYLSEVSNVNFDQYLDYEIFIVNDRAYASSQVPQNLREENYTLRDGVKLHLLYKK